MYGHAGYNPCISSDLFSQIIFYLVHHLPRPFFIPAQVFRGQPLHREVLSTASDLSASYST